VTKSELLAFMRRHPLAVEATLSLEGAPQAAVIGVVVSDELEVFFDTLATSRKYANLKRDPRVALVMGWDLDEGCTLQLEGCADEPLGDELQRLQRLYFAAFPDGVERQAWPEIAYVRVRPSWLRFSDFRTAPPAIVEFDRAGLDALG
jgi:uncharacterized pyridoxamine 5'-phosphate oxidase family protein